jgi:homoserine O-acetyltransferase
MELFDLGDFTFRSGVTVPGTQLAYQTYGTLNAARDNVILFPAFLGAEPDALARWIGPGRPLDPERYFLVLPGHFGLAPSTSPSNAAAPYEKGGFPEVHIADDVIAQERLLREKFGVEQVQLVLGWSVGALQTFEWAVRFPEKVLRMASIAGAPRPSPWTRLWLKSALEEPLTGDPNFNGGFYADKAQMQAGVRRMAHVTAITLPPLGFYREGEEVYSPLGFASERDVEKRFFEAFWLPQDPNNIIAQARKARAADPAEGGDIVEALGRITAKTLVLAFTGDFMFPPAEGRRDAERIKGAQYREVSSVFGHLATFALSEQDVKAVDAALRELLDS